MDLHLRPWCKDTNSSPLSVSFSPPSDLEFVNRPFAVVVVDEVLVTDADALLVYRDSSLAQVTNDAVEQVVDISHGLPRPERHVHLAVVLEQLGLALRTLEPQGVEERALVRSDGHLLLVDAHFELGETRLSLHGSQFGNLHYAL